MVVLDANISFSNLWSTAQFVLDRAITLRHIIFLFCFHVKWEIRTGVLKQGRSAQGISPLGWLKDTLWYYVLSFLLKARLRLRTKPVETVPVSSQSVGPNNRSPASLQLCRRNQPIEGRLKQLSSDQLMLNWQKSLHLPGGSIRTGLSSIPAKRHTILQDASPATSLDVCSARISPRSPPSAVAVPASRSILKFLRIEFPQTSCVAPRSS